MDYAEVTLPPSARSAAEARRYVSAELQRRGAIAAEWTAAQLVGELATNAIIHGGTAFTVAVAVSSDAVRIEVTDTSPGRPRLRAYGAEATTGRGLQLLDSLCLSWGVLPRPAGKTVWCELALADGPPGGLPDLDAFADLDAMLSPATRPGSDAAPAAAAPPPAAGPRAHARPLGGAA